MHFPRMSRASKFTYVLFGENAPSASRADSSACNCPQVTAPVAHLSTGLPRHVAERLAAPDRCGMRTETDSHPLQHQVFLARDAIRAGLVTYRELRTNARWTPVLRGVYADSSLPFNHRTKLRGAALLLPSAAVVTGLSSAYLWGVEVASGSDPVDVIVPPKRRFGPVRGLRIGYSGMNEREITRLGGIRTATPASTAWELTRRLPLLQAVSVIDALLHRGVLEHEDLTTLLTQCDTRAGASAARRAFALTDRRAESPPESVVRVRLTLAGFPPPIPQYEIVANGRFIARMDLAWPQYRIAIEYDGIWHADPGQFARDRRRLNALIAAGWTVYHITGSQLYDWDVVVRDLWRLIDLHQTAAS